MADSHLHALADELRKVSDADLAVYRTNRKADQPETILAEKEFERRGRIHQHELDLQLIAKQVRWQKFSAIIGIVATIAGAVAGALLTFWLQAAPQPTRKESSTPPSQEKTDKNTSADHTENVNGPIEISLTTSSRRPPAPALARQRDPKTVS